MIAKEAQRSQNEVGLLPGLADTTNPIIIVISLSIVVRVAVVQVHVPGIVGIVRFSSS